MGGPQINTEHILRENVKGRRGFPTPKEEGQQSAQNNGVFVDTKGGFFRHQTRIGMRRKRMKRRKRKVYSEQCDE